MHLVGFGTPGGENPGELLFGDGNPWVRFVVFQHDVVMGFELLDHAVFQQQRFPFGVHHSGLYVADFGDEHTDFGGIMLFVEIGGYAPFQTLGLANIYDGALVVQKTIYARLFRQGFEYEFQIFAYLFHVEVAKIQFIA